MRKRGEFLVYAGTWLLAVAALILLLMQNVGNARIVNYSGIVRGATQKLVKEELQGQPDDLLMERLDGILENLKTGQGAYKLHRSSSRDFQRQLEELEVIWKEIKGEIAALRQGLPAQERLFALSQTHFEMADQMVFYAEADADRKLARSIAWYVVVLVLSIIAFFLISRREERMLEKSVYTDHLTGICNRAGFEVAAAVLLRQWPERHYTIVELDIDDFKFINSTYGYDFGDKLLRTIAQTLQERYCDDQLCARIDADDFVVLADRADLSLPGLQALLAQAVRERLFLDVCDLITFTVAGYEIDGDGEMIQSVMDKANMAHKHAKTQGKANVMWYSSALMERLRQENLLQNRMHRALVEGEFQMYLQPKLRLQTGEVYGAEALVRWETPEWGRIFPDDFIPLFERNGSIVELDFYMLERACAYVKRHLEVGGAPLAISVNFSRVTVYRQGFPASVLEVIDRHQIPRSCIEVELTESAFNEISEPMVARLLELEGQGVAVSMDDFGSGYSSLNLLDRLPIQILKIDREFLREYGEREAVKDIVSCVVELAHALDLTVVCEGVEKAEHVAFLREIGCDCGQGYYFSKPVPEEDFWQRSLDLVASSS